MPLYMEITSIIKHFFNNDVRKLQKEFLVSLSALEKKYEIKTEDFEKEKNSIENIYKELIGTHLN